MIPKKLLQLLKRSVHFMDGYDFLLYTAMIMMIVIIIITIIMVILRIIIISKIFGIVL